MRAPLRRAWPRRKRIRSRRKKLGFATANLDSDIIGDVLGDLEKGVYAAFYQTAKTTEPKRAVVNVGVAPTFEGQEQPVKLVEAHLLDHDGSDLYGDALALLMVAFIRPEMKFDGIDALKAQIGADCETAKGALADAGFELYRGGLPEGGEPARAAERDAVVHAAGRLGRRGPVALRLN